MTDRARELARRLAARTFFAPAEQSIDQINAAFAAHRREVLDEAAQAIAALIEGNRMPMSLHDHAIDEAWRAVRGLFDAEFAYCASCRGTEDAAPGPMRLIEKMVCVMANVPSSTSSLERPLASASDIVREMTSRGAQLATLARFIVDHNDASDVPTEIQDIIRGQGVRWHG